MRTSMSPFRRVSWSTGLGVTVWALVLSALAAAAATTPPVLWTAGGLDAGNGGAGQASRMAVDTAGNVTVVSGPAGGGLLAVTSYTADGVLRRCRNLCVASMLEAVRASAGTTIHIDLVNRLLMERHWQKEVDLTDF